VLLAAQPELVTPALRVVQRVVTRHLLGQAGLQAHEGRGGAVTLILAHIAHERPSGCTGTEVQDPASVRTHTPAQCTAGRCRDAALTNINPTGINAMPAA
jgi:hypothetical protein